MRGEGLAARGRIWALAGILSVLSVSLVFWQKPINRAVSIPLLLHSESPAQDWLFDLANQLADPTEFLLRCWKTGKVVHRQLVALYLKEKAVTKASWLTGAGSLLVEAASDGDMSVRELALGTLETLDDPSLTDCAQEQLSDPDPLVRQLGLEYLRKAEPGRGVPLVIPLLDDPDLRVAARAEIALSRWTKQDFGARVRLAIPTTGQSPSRGETDENLDKLRQAIARRKEWWQLHRSEFTTNIARAKRSERVDSARPPVSDFDLRDVNGKTVRLSDFKGRPVLLNFWATWCTACLAEMPQLIALQKELGERIAIIGVSEDGVTDEHGHTHEASESEGHIKPKSAADIRKAVMRTVKTRNMNYTVLLDPDYSVGSRFNGGELPTTVLIDASGRVRRRFIGERTREVFQAMIADAARP